MLNRPRGLISCTFSAVKSNSPRSDGIGVEPELELDDDDVGVGEVGSGETELG